jgi:hypothetical protein
MRLPLSARPDGMTRWRDWHSDLHALASPRQVEKRGVGSGVGERGIFLVFGKADALRDLPALLYAACRPPSRSARENASLRDGRKATTEGQCEGG